MEEIATIGTPNFFNSYKLSDGSLANIQVIDTSGQERFRSINESYYKKADCCLLVYDITNKKTFDECKYYSKEIKERCKKNVKVILLGNKTDLEDKRVIPPEMGARLALENRYIFMETSCFKNKNVADAFQTLIEITNREYRINNPIRRVSSRIVIDKKDHKKKDDKEKKKGC